MQWEILGNVSLNDATSPAVTGWDTSRWDPKWKEEEEAESARGKRAQAQECFRRGARGLPALSNNSGVEEVDIVAAGLREAVVDILDQHARKKWWCSHSKRWWNPELCDLRKLLGKARQDQRVAGISQVQEARRNLRRAIRKAKRGAGTSSSEEQRAGTSGLPLATLSRGLTRQSRCWYVRTERWQRATATASRLSWWRISRRHQAMGTTPHKVGRHLRWWS